METKDVDKFIEESVLEVFRLTVLFMSRNHISVSDDKIIELIRGGFSDMFSTICHGVEMLDVPDRIPVRTNLINIVLKEMLKDYTPHINN